MNEDQEEPSYSISKITPLPPRKRKVRRKKAKAIKTLREVMSEAPAEQTSAPKEAKTWDMTGAPKSLDAPPPNVSAWTSIVTLADIQRAKATIALAEAALGVVHAKQQEASVPTHPQHLEDPAMGDKTPAVVEWYQTNDPDEYVRRYSGRKTHISDRRKERPPPAFPAGVNPAPFPADPDGKFKVGDKWVDLSKTDHSGNTPQPYRA